MQTGGESRILTMSEGDGLIDGDGDIGKDWDSTGIHGSPPRKRGRFAKSKGVKILVPKPGRG